MRCELSYRDRGKKPAVIRQIFRERRIEVNDSFFHAECQQNRRSCDFRETGNVEYGVELHRSLFHAVRNAVCAAAEVFRSGSAQNDRPVNQSRMNLLRNLHFCIPFCGMTELFLMISVESR